MPRATPPREVTQLLIDWNAGNEDALERLAPLIYTELRRIAGGYLRRERKGHSFQSVDLANEAYLRLIDHNKVSWQNRAHFFAIAATMMRRILVDHARKRQAGKRGGGEAHFAFDEAFHVPAKSRVDLVALDDAMRDLEALNERQSRIVELRYYGGLTVKETASFLGISTATVDREWNAARTWLYRELTNV